jgi:hypothetical protein
MPDYRMMNWRTLPVPQTAVHVDCPYAVAVQICVRECLVYLCVGFSQPLVPTQAHCVCAAVSLHDSRLLVSSFLIC